MYVASRAVASSSFNMGMGENLRKKIYIEKRSMWLCCDIDRIKSAILQV